MWSPKAPTKKPNQATMGSPTAKTGRGPTLSKSSTKLPRKAVVKNGVSSKQTGKGPVSKISHPAGKKWGTNNPQMTKSSTTKIPKQAATKATAGTKNKSSTGNGKTSGSWKQSISGVKGMSGNKGTGDKKFYGLRVTGKTRVFND